jgi:hypothetical protein
MLKRLKPAPADERVADREGLWRLIPKDLNFLEQRFKNHS